MNRGNGMDISYKKDGQQKFIILKDYDIDENNYKLQMILNNNIEGLVPFTIRNVNNQSEIWYDTTSLVVASSLYSRKLMTGEDVFNFIKAIKALSDNLREYLLDINNIWFSMDMIFAQRGEKKYRFCYCPEDEGFFQEKIRALFDQLLEYIDHNDRKAVLICYGIQQITIGDDFTIGDLLEFANKNIKYKEPQPTVNENVDICYKKDVNDAKAKETFIQKIKRIISKESKYETSEDLTNDYGLVQEECDFDEDRTILLTGTLNNGISLRQIGEEREITIIPKEYPCIVGSSLKSSDLYIENPVVSRVHMRISEEMGEYFIEDLNSTNGTFINEKRIKSHQLEKIVVGDVITIANLQFMVE